jgi:nickel transport protein
MKFRLLYLAALFPAMASGHDLWIERNGPLHSLIYGHERSGHEGSKRLEYKPESVQQARCFDTTGQEIRVDPGKQYPVTLKGDCAVSWFLLSSGYWSKTPYGTKNLPKNEAGAVMDSWRSVEAIKRLDRWGAALARPMTQALELVPTNNPLSLKTGDKLRLHAFYQGKPAANVTVAYFGKPRGVSGADGAVNIRLSEAGFQLIQASLETPLDDGKADKTIHSSTLQFELP